MCSCLRWAANLTAFSMREGDGSIISPCWVDNDIVYMCYEVFHAEAGKVVSSDSTIRARSKWCRETPSFLSPSCYLLSAINRVQNASRKRISLIILIGYVFTLEPGALSQESESASSSLERRRLTVEVREATKLPPLKGKEAWACRKVSGSWWEREDCIWSPLRMTKLESSLMI